MIDLGIRILLRPQDSPLFSSHFDDYKSHFRPLGLEGLPRQWQIYSDGEVRA